MIKMFSLIALLSNQNKVDVCRAKKANSIKYRYRKYGLMHQCSPEHLHIGTAKIKLDKETEEDKRKRVNI